MSRQNALIVNGSPRRRKNTAWLCSLVDAVLQKKEIRTKVVSAVSLKSVNNGCIGCEGCQRSKEFLCVFKDEVQPLVAEMPSYQYVIFATPVYFFNSSAQLKLVVDRMYSLLKTDKEGNYQHPFSKETKFGLIVTAGGNENEGCDLTVATFQRIADILERPLETFVMPSAPFSPEEIENPEEYEKQAEDFCRRLLGVKDLTS